MRALISTKISPRWGEQVGEADRRGFSAATHVAGPPLRSEPVLGPAFGRTRGRAVSPQRAEI
jgi:hypothetical protein